MSSAVMSPAVMRAIFCGFVLVLVGVAVNAFLLQPDPATRVTTGFPAANSRTMASPSATQPSSARGETKPSEAKLADARLPLIKPAPPRQADPQPADVKPSLAERVSVAVGDAAREPVRVARLTTDSAKAAVMPHLPEAEGDPDITLRVQKDLLARGYGPVAANGIIGPLTRAAIMAYEFDNAMPLTGEATEILLRRMRDGVLVQRVAHAEARKIRSPEAEQVVRTVQHSLTTLGFEPGRIDGRVGEETERAIRTFEAQANMQVTGRISAELFSHLARAIGARSSRAVP